MSLQILNPSYFTTIQDRGRFGFSHIGVTNSGVMDEFSYLILNKLLRNKIDENVLEISFSNFEVKILANTQIAITGAYCDFYINGILKKTWQTYNVKVGDILKIGKFKSGAKVYLGVKNGFKINKEFGSNSTTIKENLGGIDGGFLSKDDILKFDEYFDFNNYKIKEEFLPKYEDSLTLRVMLSYQNEYFEKEEIEKFFSSTFTITNDFNRMACKLEGERISCKIDGIISEAIAFGSIQIPSDGKPIILLKDRQTIGGYPKIGVVLASDCFKLVQLKANCKIRFELIDFDEALIQIQKFYQSFN